MDNSNKFLFAVLELVSRIEDGEALIKGQTDYLVSDAWRMVVKQAARVREVLEEAKS